MNTTHFEKKEEIEQAELQISRCFSWLYLKRASEGHDQGWILLANGKNELCTIWFGCITTFQTKKPLWLPNYPHAQQLSRRLQCLMGEVLIVSSDVMSQKPVVCHHNLAIRSHHDQHIPSHVLSCRWEAISLAENDFVISVEGSRVSFGKNSQQFSNILNYYYLDDKTCMVPLLLRDSTYYASPGGQTYHLAVHRGGWAGHHWQVPVGGFVTTRGLALVADLPRPKREDILHFAARVHWCSFQHLTNHPREGSYTVFMRRSPI